MIFYKNQPNFLFSMELHHYSVSVDFVFETPWMNIMHLWKLKLFHTSEVLCKTRNSQLYNKHVIKNFSN